MSAYNFKIIGIKGDWLREEADAAGTITPGMLIEDDGTGSFQAHSTAAGTARKLFALENDLIGDTIDDDYSSGDHVIAALFQPGAEAFALLATGNNVSVGDGLVSDGNGALQAATTTGGEETIVAFAAESINNTTGSNVRILVKVA